MELTTQYLTSLKHDWINHRRAMVLATLIVLLGATWAWLTFAADNPIVGFWLMVVGALLVTVGALVFDKQIEKWFEASLKRRSGYTFSQLMHIVSLPGVQRAAEHQSSDTDWRNAEIAVAGMAVGKWVNWCNWTFRFIGVSLLFVSSSLAYERWKEDQPRSPLILDAPTIEIFNGIATPPREEPPMPPTSIPPATAPQDPPPGIASARPSPIANGQNVVPDPTKKTDPIDPGKAAATVTNLAINTELNAKATYQNLGELIDKIGKVNMSSADSSERIEDINNALQTAQDYLNKLEKDDLVPADVRERAEKLANSFRQAQKTLSDPSKSPEDKAKAIEDLVSKIAEFLKVLGAFLEMLGSFLDQLFGSESGLGKSLKEAGQGLRAAGQKAEDMANRAKGFTQQLARQLEAAEGVVRIAKDEWERGVAGRVGDSTNPEVTPAPELGEDGQRPKSSNPSAEEVDDPTAKTPNAGSLPGPK